MRIFLLMLMIVMCVLPCIAAEQSSDQAVKEISKLMPSSKVDFSYAFGLPHRITVALPDSSNKTLIDVDKDCLGMRWTYGNLLQVPLNAHQPLTSTWSATFWPEIDGRRLGIGSYGRAEHYLPVLENTYKDTAGIVQLQVVGGATAAITRVEVHNTSDKPHQFDFIFLVDGAFAEVPGYVIDGEPLDFVTSGWNGRADRIMAMAVGANCPRRNSRTVSLQWNLKPGEVAVGWLVRPYEAYEEDAPKLRKHDWVKEFEKGKAAWRSLLSRAVMLQIPDAGVRNSYYAGLADTFIMREPVADGYIACSPGTEGYRCPNSIEAAVAAVGLDQAGLHHESAIGYQMCLDQQGKDGNWADPKGWCHRFWSASGFKSWAIIEHYKLTGDKAYLEKAYPRMLASSHFQEKQRARTRVLVDGKRPLTYGLMPRGVGDCGLDAGDGWYGVYYPHNIWAVYGDKLTLEVAQILGKTEDVPTLRRIYKQAYDDLIASIDGGSIQQDDYRWIPCSPLNNTSGSRWGVLNAAFPCGLLSSDSELITGTLQFMNSRLSPGGLQMHTGYMVNGMWVAISLDNVAEVELFRGNGDEFARLLYACLNHGTPLYTWCEERGQDPGTTECGGDRQHLWTPVAVVRSVRDCMVMEDGDVLHLARGTARDWLGSGEPLGISKAPTHFGDVSYEIKYNTETSHVTGKIVFPKQTNMKWAVLHIRLPNGMKVKSVENKSGYIVLPDRSGVKWKDPQGTVVVDIDVS